MINIGDLCEVGNEIGVCISETDSSLELLLKDSDGRYSLRTNISREKCKVVGQVPREELEMILRDMIKKDVGVFYKRFHVNSKEFAPGDRIPYAGRVYDESEMFSLLDASLDFWLTSGRFTKEFELSFAKKLGVRYSYLVNSGSSANLLAFAALTSHTLGDRAIKPGDEVITVAAGFPTTVSPIIQFGCVPVFVDIELGTHNIDTSFLEEARSSRTKAVMIAHALGNPFNLGVVTEFCKKHGLFLIEDNCDALGAKYKGQLTGTFGDVGTSSFYPPHHLTMGEGGAVYSNNLKLKKAIESFRDWGRDCWCEPGCDNTCGKRFGHQLGTLPFGYDHKYIYQHLGFNLKATDMQASIGVEQLKKLDTFVAKRNQNWRIFYEGLKDLEDVFILPEATKDSEPSWFGFALSVREGFSRSDIVSHLEKLNIQTRMLFAGNLTRQPCFTSINPSSYRVIGDLKNTDFVMNNLFWLGVYPGLKQGMIEYVVEVLRKLVRG